MTAGISFDGTLESFFYERISASLGDRKERLSPDVEAYAVHLLVSFVRRRRVAGRTAPPLALEYLRAVERGPAALRDVGDRALSIAGIVPHSLSRGPVDVRYVRSIGTSAYAEIAARVPNLSVFEGVAQSFETLEVVLGDAAKPDDAGDGALSLLERYERWRKSRSRADEIELSRAGVLLDPEGNDEVH